MEHYIGDHVKALKRMRKPAVVAVISRDVYRPPPLAKRPCKDKTNTNKNGCTEGVEVVVVHLVGALGGK